MADNRQFVLSAIVQVLDKATGPLQKIGRGFGTASLQLDRTANRLNAISERTKKMGDSFSSAGRTLTTGITLPIIGAGIAALKTFGDFEMMTANFTTMFQGNEKAAKGFLKTIEDYANVTPYTTRGLAKNAQTMLQFGISSEKVMPILKQLGDIAGGNTERMDALALAFSQVSSAGRLQGQDLLQMVNAGFNPLQIISQKTGKSMAELKDIMSKGGISANAVAEAFKLATEKGGLFYKGAERGSKTLYGLFSTLKDEGEKSLRMLGESIKDSLNLSEELPKLAKRISEVTKKVSEWIKENPELTKFLIKFLLISATVGPTLLVFGKLMSTVSVITKGFSIASRGAGAFLKVLGLLGKTNMTSVLGKFSALGKVLGPIGIAIGLFEGMDLILESIQKKMEAIPGLFDAIGQHAAILTAGIPILSQFGFGWQMKANQNAKARSKITADQKKEIEKLANDIIKTSSDPEKIKRAQEILKSSQTEITIKVQAEEGTSANVDKIKSKGNTKPKVSYEGYTGNIYLYGN
jgi:tape measure domain-containing protein